MSRVTWRVQVNTFCTNVLTPYQHAVMWTASYPYMPVLGAMAEGEPCSVQPAKYFSIHASCSFLDHVRCLSDPAWRSAVWFKFKNCSSTSVCFHAATSQQSFLTAKLHALVVSIAPARRSASKHIQSHARQWQR